MSKFEVKGRIIEARSKSGALAKYRAVEKIIGASKDGVTYRVDTAYVIVDSDEPKSVKINMRDSNLSRLVKRIAFRCRSELDLGSDAVPHVLGDWAYAKDNGVMFHEFALSLMPPSVSVGFKILVSASADPKEDRLMTEEEARDAGINNFVPADKDFDFIK